MPQSIAIMKVRGFASDTGGTLVAHEPNLIRLRLEKLGVRSAAGKLAWLGLGRKSDGPAELTLILKRSDPNREPNRLTLHALFRPLHSQLLQDDAWRSRCSELFVQLRAYLMG
jgi:eukaryotic-like serine/threonine-protein kinase